MMRRSLIACILLFVLIEGSLGYDRDLLAKKPKCKKLYARCNGSSINKKQCCDGNVCRRSPRTPSIFTCQKKEPISSSRPQPQPQPQPSPIPSPNPVPSPILSPPVTPAFPPPPSPPPPPTGVTPNSIIQTVAGTGVPGYSSTDGQPATNAQLYRPFGLAIDLSKNYFIADNNNDRIRRVLNSNGLIGTVAGTGIPGYNGDSIPAVNAQINKPMDVCLSNDGQVLYIADTKNYRIRRVDLGPSGLITTMAGNGAAGFSGDNGPAVNAQLNDPSGIALDPTGSKLYIGDTLNHRVRRVDLSSGNIITVAGTGAAGYTGDYGQAIAAQLNKPMGVYVDKDNKYLYISDSGNNAIRRVDLVSGIIITLVGTGVPGYAGDNGPAGTAQLYTPCFAQIDPTGRYLDIGDSNNYRVRRVDLDAPSKTIITLAGRGTPAGYGGDGGSANGAIFYLPTGITHDSSGSVYISDSNNFRVRKVLAS